MAKGLRSSTKKTNRSKLRAKVFGPVEAARTERLSVKLLELARMSTDNKVENHLDVEMKDPSKFEQRNVSSPPVMLTLSQYRKAMLQLVRYQCESLVIVSAIQFYQFHSMSGPRSVLKLQCH
jgi:hypothetical protein